MKKFIVIEFLLFISVNLFSNPISKDSAEKVAIHYFNYKLKPNQANFTLKSPFKILKESTPAYYTFNFEGGGWAIISATDAAIPILAYSTEGSFDENNINSSMKSWLEGYNNQILYAIKNKIQNAATAKEWQNALNSNFNVNNNKVGPLLTCTWDQKQFYNDSCPADKGAPAGFNGHVPAGCVAIALAQIMKYYSYPLKGIGSHSYFLPKYGTVSADFGNTKYNWDNMPDIVDMPNKDIAGFIYQCGVAIDMQYDSTSSGADFLQSGSSSPEYALVNHFGYHDSIQQYNRTFDSIGNELWIARLKLELDKHRPIYYAGCSNADCHAYVCDGYDNSFPAKFHFNWGWGGVGNGYFAITAIPNDNNYVPPYNIYNSIFTNIRPNLDYKLSFQIVTPDNEQSFPANSLIKVDLDVLYGSPKKFNLYIDNVNSDSVLSVPYTFTINSKSLVLGEHTLKVTANDGKTSVSEIKIFRINAGNLLGLQTVIPASVYDGVQYFSIVNPNIVWATIGGKTNLFAKTSNGGTTWDTGHIITPVFDSLRLSNVCGINSQKAYACFSPQFNHGGAILFTSDGGKTWKQQTSADFSNSYANWVYFFDKKNGVCMGNPYFNKFCIYTTNNEGITWNSVSTTNVPDAIEGELGIQNNFDTYHNLIWFGTSKGRIFKSFDKGLNWSVSDSIFSQPLPVSIRFKDSIHAIATQSSDEIYKTNDAGKTWAKAITNIIAENLEFVPGTDSTWVNYSCNNVISIDDAKSFYGFDESFCISKMKFLSPSIGWVGCSYSYALEGVPIYNWEGLFSSIKKINVTFHVVDKKGNPLPGANINMNGNAGNTDVSGNAKFTIVNFGRPVTYSLMKNSYEINNGSFSAVQDTAIKIVMELLSKVTFNVLNLINKPVEGISIFFNDSLKITNPTGQSTFTDLMAGQYIYTVLKANEYIDYGMLAIDKNNNYNVNIIFLTDSFYSSKKTTDKVFPNPASDILCLMSDSTMNTVKLFDISGSLLFELQANSNVVLIPVQSFHNGIYFLQALKKRSTKTYKVIIKH
jgi:photosystem II stability/assembly factor-like uncharacterized protein